jgi:type IV secretion system protein VirB10
LMMFIPHKKTPSAGTTLQTNNQNDATLSENMALINQLRNKTAPREREAPRSGMHPPKIREAAAPEGLLSKEMLLRMNASTTFEIERGNQTETQAMAEKKEGDSAKALAGTDPNSQFLNGQQDISMVSAKRLPHPDLTVPAGEMIPATLETAINSDLPGMVRAITTRDVFSLVGSQRLIPRGSTLVGQFNSTVADGQTRVLVVWNRVQMADGVIVTLDSPGTDQIGRSGQGADFIDRHFFERFGTSALLSVLGAYTAMGGVGNQTEFNSASQYRMAISNSFQQASGQSLSGSINTKPTLSINQGAEINVFVAHDLDFKAVGAALIDNKKRGVFWK